MAMTVQEIISEADELYPNGSGLTTASKVRKLNNLQRVLFRTIYKKEEATTYDIVTSQYLYPLDFDISKILNVLVNGVEYDKENIVDKEAESPYYYFYENSVALYPTPDKNITAGLLLWHHVEPAELSSTVLGAAPEFDGDFHKVLVYGLCLEMAKVDKNADMVDTFQKEYSRLVKEFKEANPEPELSSIGVG